MSDPLVEVACAARTYCAVVQETTATPSEMVTGGLWVARMLDLRNRQEIAYSLMAHALRVAGYPPPDPVIDEMDEVTRRRLAVHDASEEGWRVLTVMRAVAAGRWPPAHPAPEYVERVQRMRSRPA